MTHTTHIPPSSPRSAALDTEVHRPDRFVLRACALIWWSFGVQLVSKIFGLTELPPDRSLGGALFTLAIAGAISFAVTSWIVSKLSAGRSWMRLLITILFVISGALAITFWNIYLEAAQFTVLGGIAAALQWVLNAIAVVFINMPSARLWFLVWKGRASRAA